MIRNTLILVLNDLAIALKNKTIYLILFIPFFVFISLQLIDRNDVTVSNIKLGLLQAHSYDPAVLKSISSVDKLITVTWIKSEPEGRRLLKEKQLDAVLLTNSSKPSSLALLVLKKESLHTLAIVETFTTLQKAAEGSGANWITAINTLHQGGLQSQTLPTWILMLTLLVGFIILPAQVAEEKEKKLLLALLQTPMHEVQWLLAKVITGMIMIMIAVFFLHLLGSSGKIISIDYTAFIIAGSFCFSSFGVFLGFLCRSQASARTLGVVFYLPHLLPSALADFSAKLTAVAPLLPSYQFYEPVKTILLEEGRTVNMSFELVYLLTVGAITFYLAYLLLKRRWLM